ncbi:MAG: galactokinase family protein [Candidatus Acidiferrales bacterium]
MTPFDVQLRASGMSAAESSAKAALLEKLMRELHALRGGTVDSHSACFVPGRLEFLGKHTDYAGGRSLICAIERGICIVAAPRSDAQIRMLDVGRASTSNFALDAAIEPTAGNWSNFPMTVARRLARDFPETRIGADIAFSSDLPRASGMSSSSALIVAVFFVLARLNHLWQTAAYRRAVATREDLSAYIAAIESGASFGYFSGARGVGTHGGSEDHVAIVCSRAGFLRQYSFCPVHFEREIRLPARHVFVIGVSGVKADKTGDAREAYNRSSGAARKILDLWRGVTRRTDPSLAAALSSRPDAIDQLRQILRDSSDAEFPASLLLNRLAQFAEESNEIVPSAADALVRADFARLGALVARSQFLAETLLANQLPETIKLARSARSLGAVAASAFGAGFGGSVWALVDSNRAEEFCNAWATHYHQRFPELADASRFFLSCPGPGLVQFE